MLKLMLKYFNRIDGSTECVCDPHHSVKWFFDHAGPCRGESFEFPVLVQANVDCEGIFQSACRKFFNDDRCD